ncbi:uncharacterized protein YALI1_F07361g [Yarrowia lipolytica]|uniref:Uncharacterized protein n=1 Tax=Yarrowia lipolytica TaxID=4952 RepID=A0A1D8NM06_YARLL|nr:hypothetical protein YALI1_F07361g [Yarrowia lipolytica]
MRQCEYHSLGCKAPEQLSTTLNPRIFVSPSPSSSHALRACINNYQPLTKDLFNPPFYSCWSELYYKLKDDLLLCFYVSM